MGDTILGEGKPPMTTEKSTEWHQRASRSIPGAVSSPVRAFQAVGGTPRYFTSGAGSRVTDVDGNEYVDLVGSWGPMILGHAHPAVVDAVITAATQSFSFGAPSINEVLLAEEILDRVDAIDRVRFVSSGTEAVMTALRLARAATGRPLIVKFAGCYHGHVDSMLVKAGSGVATLGLAASPGITERQVGDTIVVDYNDSEALRQVFTERGCDIAAIITEAAAANMGVVPPSDEFLATMSELCRAHGALLILDEVMTGFRISRAGWWGKFGREKNIHPDLFTYGKVIGGGFPVAAVAGRAEVMDQLAPLGSVYQAGTLSGNPVATASGLATLQHLTEESYRHLDLRAAEVGQAVSDALSSEGVAHALQSEGNLFSVFFCEGPVRDFSDASAQNTKKFGAFFHAMLDGGVSLPPSAFEAWFVSTAMTDDDVAIVAQAARVAAKVAAGA
jgi:glutamate-1-semialdehyde 2,1-aminomutase